MEHEKKVAAAITSCVLVILGVAGGVHYNLTHVKNTSAVYSGEQPTLKESSTVNPTPLTDPPRRTSALSDTGHFTVENAHGESMIQADYDSMPYVTPLNPAGPQATMTRWVDGWGVPPSQAENGTVYVLGHAWAQTPLVFNPLSEAVTAAALDTDPKTVDTLLYPVYRKSTSVLNGSKIHLTDNQGNKRTWVVDDAWMVDKEQAIDDKDLMDDAQPGRIVLIACSVSGAEDLGYNVMVQGHLINESAGPTRLNLTA